MRRAKSIVLGLIGGASVAAGCGGPQPPAPAGGPVPAAPLPAGQPVDFTWRDALGNEVPEAWATDADGHRIPDPHPCDRDGRPWVFDLDGDLIPFAAAIPVAGPGGPATGAHATTHHTTVYRRSPSVVPIFLGSGYRSPAGGTGAGYRTFAGPSTASPSTRGAPSAGSITRGGFGSTGSSRASSGGARSSGS